MSNSKTIKIDDTLYEQVGQRTAGTRAVVVLDRGWIVAGDVEDVDGRIKITRAVHVRSWSTVGFDGMVANPKTNVVLRAIPNGFDCPADSELFRVPVADDWGL